MNEQGFRILEHTADMGIEATGETCEQLFAETARGLMEILGGCGGGDSEPEERIVELEGVDREDLLVHWLGEILYLVETGGFYPTSFEVEEASEEHLRARVRGALFDSACRPLDREVKAITYHRLAVEKQDGGWRAQVYVDI